MKQNPQPNSNPEQSVILNPAPRLPLIITTLGFVLLPLPLHPWPTILISFFGLVLLFQALTLRIEFSSKALIVWQLGKEIRRFPFEDWLAWRLLLPQLPGILYFREKASPHLLPILFDPKELTNQLRLKVGALEKPKT